MRISVRVKICGVTNMADAIEAAKLGAWAVGFVFYKKSPRFISPFKARKIIQALPPFISPVGVFLDHREGAVKDIVKFCGLRILQFHGSESPAYCQRFNAQKVIKAFQVSKDFDVRKVSSYKVSAYLFDTFCDAHPGGTGHVFDWSLIKNCKDFGVPVILSGGINKDNILAAIDDVRPYAIDISSGVEDTPGRKSHVKLKQLFETILS